MNRLLSVLVLIIMLPSQVTFLYGGSRISIQESINRTDRFDTLYLDKGTYKETSIIINNIKPVSS